MEKRKVAKELFLSGKTYNEISELLDVNPATVRSWGQRGKWGKLGDAKTKNAKKKEILTKYETNVKPYFENIQLWISEGLTEKQISRKLKISYASFNIYKNKQLELLELIRNSKEKYRETILDYMDLIASGVKNERVTNKDKNNKKVNDYKTGVCIQEKENSTTNIQAAHKRLQYELNRKNLEHKIEIENLKFEHQKKIDNEKLKLLKNINDSDIPRDEKIKIFMDKLLGKNNEE